MNRAVHLALTIILLFSSQLFAQTKIEGIVFSKSGDTLSGTNIYIKDSFDGASSKANGSFSFTTLLTGKQILVVSMIGYEGYQSEIQLNGKLLNLKIIIAEGYNELNTVTISAGTFETGDTKKMAVLNSIDIATTAGATADILSALKTLPGTQPASEADGMFVRGGDAHEAKTYFDGILVKNVYTNDLPDIAQRGRFSPFMFKGTSFSAGAYSAQYGQALSSVLSLESKDIAPKTKTDIGIMSVGIDGNRTQHFKNSSLEVNGGYYNLKPAFSIIKQNTEWTKEPESVNTNGAFKLKTSNTGLLKCYVDYTHSRVGVFTDDFSDITRKVNYDITSSNILFNSSYREFLNDKWKLNLGVGGSMDDNKIGISQDLVKQKEKTLHTNAIITRYYGKLSDVKLGVEVFNFQNSEAYNEHKHELNQLMNAAFLETNYYMTNKLAVRVGVRTEYANVIAKKNTAPRISLAYKTNPYSQASVAFGKFYQLPGDNFLFNNKQFDFENATHYIANYQYQKEEQTFRTEIYYKKYDDLLKTAEPGTNIYNNSGYGYSKGVDVFWRDKKTFKYSDYWISYSYLDTKRNYLNYSVEAAPTFAVKHALNVVYKYFVPKWNTSIGATYTYASGRPYYNPNSVKFLSDKTKEYHNFSVNVSYLTSIANHFTIVYVSVENVLGIKNVFGYRYSQDGSVRKAVEPSAPRSVFVGVFITFGDDNFKY